MGTAIVIRRAFIAVFPALVALAMLCGAPAQSADGHQASSTEWNSGLASAPSAGRALFEETNDSGLNRRADDQDEPDRIVSIGAPYSWPQFAPRPGYCLIDQVAIRRHRACAFPATGPPTS
ncbi:MAG: hypothetical protein ACRECO_05665 [Xanthobacteraceae bacterium]